jgi:DNA polymerase III subunit delta
VSELDPVYLLAGSDRPKVDLAVQRLRARFDPGAIDRFNAFTDDPGTVVAACNAGTLFGDRRLVLVDAVDGRRGDDGRLRASWKAPELEEIAAYVSAPAPGTVLCLVCEEAKRDSALVKAVVKAGTVLTYEVARNAQAKWVGERFRSRGVKAAPEACLLLVRLVGTDLHALAQEVDKIATWAGDDEVGEADVERLTAPTAETKVFAITDAWGARDRAQALEAMEAILERSEKSHRDEAARLAAAIGAHLGKLRQMKREAESGGSPRQIAERLRLHPYYAEKLIRQAEAFSESELDGATVEMASLDHALKGGSRLAPALELQRTIAVISGEPGRRR